MQFHNLRNRIKVLYNSGFIPQLVNNFIIYLILCFIAIGFCSCNDDSVSNQPATETIDTVENFNWHIDTFAYSISDILAIDTNNYYLTFSSLPYLVHFQNGTQYNIDLGSPYFRGGPIASQNENLIYVGGMLYYTNDTRAQLRALDNGVVKSYSIPDDSTWFVNTMFVDRQSNLWLSSGRYIYKFNNGEFKRFNYGDSLIGCRFYQDNSNQLYAFTVSNSYYPYKYNINRIVDDTIISINEEMITEYGQKYCGVENTCLNKDLVVSSFNNLYFFNNGDWNRFYQNNNLHFRSSVNGSSKNYLICFLNSSFVNSYSNVGLVLSEGKITYERILELSSTEIPVKIVFLNDKTVFIPTVTPSRLFIGIKK